MIEPQISRLVKESVQSPSPLIGLFRVWADSDEQSQLLAMHNGAIMESVLSLLSAPNVVNRVTDEVLRIVESLLTEFETPSDDVTKPIYTQPRLSIITPHIPMLLMNLTARMAGDNADGDDTDRPHAHVGALELSVLSQLAIHTSDEKQAESMVALLLPYLRRSGRVVSESSKHFIIKTFVEYAKKFPSTKKAIMILSQG